MTLSSRFRYSIFLFLLLITLLLGESFLRFIIFGLWGIFVLANLKQLDFSKLLCFRGVIVSWLGLLGGLLISSLFSHSLPTSLDNVMMWGTGFLLFSFFLVSKKKISISLDQLEIGILMVSVVMTIMGTAFFFLPEFATKLPGMNMFHATYGHNHLAALLLLALPFAFQRFIEKRKKNPTWFSFELLVCLFLFLGILLSFGRTIYIFTLLELFILGRIFRKEIHQSISFLFIQRILIGVSGVLIMVYFGSSLLPNLISDYTCPQIFQRVKLCKNLAAEGRWQYWEQGLRAFRDFPITGYGPGTFGLLSKRYQQNPGIYSAYAHNFFVQQLAETGIAGFLPLIGLLISISLIVVRQPKTFFTKKNQMFLLVIMMSFGNALFDFDWSFSGIFFLTLIFVAMLLREIGTEKNKIFQKQLLVVKAFFFTVLVSVLCIFVISVFTEILVLQKKYTTILHTFPYYSSQRLLFFEQTLPVADTTWLLAIYANDPTMRARLVKDVSLVEEDLFVFLSKQFELDPWSQIQPSTFYDSSIQQLTLDHQQALLEKKMLFIYSKKAQDLLPLTYDEEREIVQQFLNFTDQLVQENDFDQIGRNYVLAHKFFDWSLSDHRPFFLQYKLTDEERDQFLQEINFVPGSFFGAYASEYAGEYFTLLDTKWTDISLDNKQFLIGRILDSAHWDLGKISELVKNRSKTDWENQTNIGGKIVTMGNWKAMNMQLADFSCYPIEEINWDNQDQYVRHLVRTANLSMENQSDIEVIGNFYQEAIDFYPWILYEEKHWMEIVDWRELPLEQVQKYADQVIGWQGDQINWKIKEHVQMYQTLANWKIEQKRWDQVEKYLQAMQQVEDDEYWSKAQLGHFYLMRSEFENATREYEQCLEKSNNDHYECSVGLELTNQGKASDELYWHVSQEIFDEKNW